MIDFEKIYNIYFTDIYYFVLSLAKNKEVAEDVTSETFYKALKNIGNLKKEDSIKSYLFSIAKNTFYDYVKKNKNLINIDDYSLIPDNAISVEEKSIENELNSYLLESINLLDKPGQSIVKLRIFENLSFKEIGNLYERSQNWACVNFHRAKDKLKKIMEEKYGQI